jgi:excisionase family DNA binding protein
MNSTEHEFLTVPQVAEKLGLTRACIRRWIYERKITVVKLGRAVRIPIREIDRLVNDGLRPAKRNHCA